MLKYIAMSVLSLSAVCFAQEANESVEVASNSSEASVETRDVERRDNNVEVTIETKDFEVSVEVNRPE